MAGGRVDRSLRAGRSKGVPGLVVGSLVLFGLLVIVAIFLDAAGFARRLSQPASTVHSAADLVIEMSTSTNRYVDAARAFSIALPPRWSVAPSDMAAPFDVRLAGPHLMGIAIQVTKVPYTSLDTLVGRLQAIERDRGIDTHIERIEFKGYPAARRTSRLTRETVHALDVIAGGCEYHLQFSMPSDLDANYRAVAQAMLDSFEPIQAVAGDEAAL